MTTTAFETLPVIDGLDLLAKKIETPPWIIPNILPAGGCTIVAGQPKAGKSWATLDMALAIASGGEFLGHQVVEPGRVLYLDAETPEWALQERLRHLAAGRRLDTDALKRIRIMPAAWLNLSEQPDFDRLFNTILRDPPDLVVIDPLVRFHTLDENSASEMSPWLQAIRSLTSPRTAVLLVHHMNKGSADNGRRDGQNLRGTSDLHGWYDAGLFFTRKGSEITVGFESRYCADQPKLNVQLDLNDGAARFLVDGQPTFARPKTEEALAVLRQHPGGMVPNDLRKHLRCSGATVNSILDELEEMGLAGSRNTGGVTVWRAASSPDTCPPDCPRPQQASTAVHGATVDQPIQLDFNDLSDGQRSPQNCPSVSEEDKWTARTPPYKGVSGSVSTNGVHQQQGERQ